MKRTLLLLLAALPVLLCGARQANADAVTYTDSDTATGSIGGTTFSDALVTITFVGNASNVTSIAPGILVNNVGTGTVTIGGVGTFSFTDALEAFDNQPYVGAGIADATQGGLVILATSNSAFGTYGLTTAISPITGTAIYNSAASFPTTDGSLIITSPGNDSVFTATTTAATPEPSSMLLLVTGLGLAMARRRRPV